MLGQVFEPIVNLPFIEYPERSEWVNMAEYCKETNVLFQFYTVKGIMIPLTHIYFYDYSREEYCYYYPRRNKNPLGYG